MANPKVGQITTYDVIENIIDFSDILNEKSIWLIFSKQSSKQIISKD